MTADSNLVNGDKTPYDLALLQGKLLLRQCNSCMLVFHPRTSVCPGCGSTSPNWVEAKGEGSVYSFSVLQNYALSEEFEGEMPYALGFVLLSEGVFFFSRLIANELTDITVGAKGTVVYRHLGGNDRQVPCFLITASG